jgi:hypothetical protein
MSRRTRLQRHPERGAYERKAIDTILDEALFCHVGFVVDGQPFVIPTIHARVGDVLEDFDDDLALPIWAGVIPLSTVAGAPVAEERVPGGVAVPAYACDYRRPTAATEEIGDDGA